MLYPHNHSAYLSSLALLSKAGKAAIIHPTGTGKSMIAFKLVEDNPAKTFLWLSPSRKIWETQLENLKKSTNLIPTNITFLTYAKLLYLSDEALSALSPDYIILDEFHRAGAPEWGKRVRFLLSCCPRAKLLGLSATHIRYLDHQRDMVEELFDGCVASRMTLTEAVVRGILPAPDYVICSYSIHLEEESWRQRMSRADEPVRRRAGEILEKLVRAVNQAEGLEDVFFRHMRDPHGKYIVFCSGVAHMREMMDKSWFRKVDPSPHLYSVWSESPTAGKDYAAFRRDHSDHLRLLFCVDMFNEGIHMEDISGVILFRPTESPIIYKQQVGRALSALRSGGDSRPVIFDIVNNFDTLRSVAPVNQEACQKPFVSPLSLGTAVDSLGPFHVVDELRECRELFRKLEETLAEKAEKPAYLLPPVKAARDYAARYGNLDVARDYVTGDGFGLGRWLADQRRRRKRNDTYEGSGEIWSRLGALGMCWDPVWDKNFRLAREYFEFHHDLDLPSNRRFGDFGLGAWVRVQRKRYWDGELSAEQIRKLETIGMNWSRRKRS